MFTLTKLIKVEHELRTHTLFKTTCKTFVNSEAQNKNSKKLVYKFFMNFLSLIFKLIIY